jgi:hypothetical protein
LESDADAVVSDIDSTLKEGVYQLEFMDWGISWGSYRNGAVCQVKEP